MAKKKIHVVSHEDGCARRMQCMLVSIKSSTCSGTGVRSAPMSKALIEALDVGILVRRTRSDKGQRYSFGAPSDPTL